MSLSKLALAPVGTDATAVAAQTAVQPEAAPNFAPGYNAIAVIACKGVTGTPDIVIQGSDNGTDWTDLLSYDALTADILTAEVTVQAYMRANVLTGGSAGTFEAFLLG